MFRIPSAEDADEDDLEDLVETAGDIADVDDFDGYIYAFTFPSLIQDADFPIKIGLTTGDVADRVRSQCRSSAAFDNPKVLKTWRVRRVGAVESAIHEVLKARGKWRKDVPGTEWFNTTVDEIDRILEFVLENKTSE